MILQKLQNFHMILWPIQTILIDFGLYQLAKFDFST